MDRIEEKQLYLPSLYLMKQYPNINTGALKEKLVDLFKPTGEDAEILNDRNDTKFTQKVRNLVSHHDLDDKLGFTIYTSKRGGGGGIHEITQKGLDYLNMNVEALEYLFDNDFDYSDLKEYADSISEETKKGKKILTYDENELVSEGRMKSQPTKKYERSKKLRDIAVENYTINGTILCEACKFDFFVFYGKIGEGYIEMHHIKPVFQNDGQAEKTFISEALKNIVPVCANCHRVIHRKKKRIIRIDELKQAIGNAKTQDSPS